MILVGFRGGLGGAAVQAVRDSQPLVLCSLFSAGSAFDMQHPISQRLALALFLLYLALFPGSTIVVALGQVPAWGGWMGGALLLLQGASVLSWLIGRYGRRGALAAALVFMLGWGVEYLGITTGLPFGRYRYTEALQPRLPGAVPLAIPCAWLMIALGADDFRFLIFDFRLGRTIQNPKSKIQNGIVVATLVLLLDLQIETVAAAVNRYWVWLDGGLYYGVPAANFVAWWLLGLVMATLVAHLLHGKSPEPGRVRGPRSVVYCNGLRTTDHGPLTPHASCLTQYIPTYLYLLNTLMFTTINLARGYIAAGLIGVAVLIAAVFALALAARRNRLVISNE
jgi:uncharacterized membrane protein